MLSLRFVKVIREVFTSVQKSALVVLSIAVGVFGVGMISMTHDLITTHMTGEYLKVLPNSFSLTLSPAFDEDLVRGIESMPEILDAEGTWSKTMRFKADKNGDWVDDLQLQARRDYDKSKIDIIRPQEGKWQLGRGELALERQTLTYLNTKKGLNLRFGDFLYVEMPENEVRALKLVGTFHNINAAPSLITGSVFGFISFETVEWLGNKRLFNTLRVHVTDKYTTKDEITGIADKVKEVIERENRSVTATRLPEPGKHPADAPISALLGVMSVLGFLTLFLSGFLVTNTITAIITQQTRQIGILKAIGANTTQVSVMYFVKVLLYGLLAYGVGSFLAYYGGVGMSSYLAGLINFEIPSYQVAPSVMMIEFVVALLIPLLAAYFPIRQGTNIRVVDAVYAQQQTKPKNNQDILDKALTAIHFLPKPLVLALRNTFKERKRVLLSISTLALGGAIFMAVFSVRIKLFSLMDESLQHYNRYDIQVNFKDAHAATQLQRQASKVANVKATESWVSKTVQRVFDDGSLSEDFSLIAPPPNSQLIDPILIEGTWIEGSAKNTVVVNTEFLDTHSDITVGSTMTIKVGVREKKVTVAGIIRGILSQSTMYMEKQNFDLFVDESNQSKQLLVLLNDSSKEAQITTAKELETYFEKVNMPISSTQTLEKLVSRMQTQFSILVIFLMIMAILIAVVGGLGLAGLMSINVLERIREIGILRSIGATDTLILLIFIVEGIIIGVSSCIISTLISFPIGMFLSNIVGTAFLKAPLDFVFSWTGVALWFVLVLGIATTASAFPAWQATRITIRDVLAHE